MFELLQNEYKMSYDMIEEKYLIVYKYQYFLCIALEKISRMAIIDVQFGQTAICPFSFQVGSEMMIK